MKIKKVRLVSIVVMSEHYLNEAIHRVCRHKERGEIMVRNAVCYLMVFFSMTFSSLCKAQEPKDPWYFEVNDIRKCWDQGITGQGVSVYLLDTEVVEVASLKGKITQYLHTTKTSDLKDTKDKMHGTAMAGLIAATPGFLKDENDKSNKIFIAGIAPDSKIISHVWKPGGKLSDALLSSANDIIKKNADGKVIVPSSNDIPDVKISVINTSGGISKKNAMSANSTSDNIILSFDDSTKHVDDIIRNELKKRDALIIASVGNDGQEITINNYQAIGIFPAAFKRPKGKITDAILRVAGLIAYNRGQDPQLSLKSNYGVDFTDIAAPGLTPVITEKGTAIDKTFGTSNAAAITTGAVALLASCNLYATAAELRRALLDNSEKKGYLENKVDNGRVLNIYKVVKNYCVFPEKIIENPEEKEMEKSQIRAETENLKQMLLEYLKNERNQNKNNDTDPRFLREINKLNEEKRFWRGYLWGLTEITEITDEIATSALRSIEVDNADL